MKLVKFRDFSCIFIYVNEGLIYAINKNNDIFEGSVIRNLFKRLLNNNLEVRDILDVD